MSNPGNPQNPYSPPTQQGATGYPQQTQQRPPLDKAVTRQVLFGGATVVGIAIVSNLLSIIGSSMFSFRGELIFSLIWSVFIAAVFVVGAGVSALYVAPLARATSAVDLLKKLAIAAAIGSAALLVLNFIWAVISGGQYLFQMIVSSGILGSVSTGLHYGAFFALGVFIARTLPPKPQAVYTGQPQGYAQPGSVAPQGYGQPGSVPPQGYGQPPAQQQPPFAPQA
jgi:4-amino-4-deoxy-L-arabinose transferase-like glycosyltransferase